MLLCIRKKPIKLNQRNTSNPKPPNNGLPILSCSNEFEEFQSEPIELADGLKFNPTNPTVNHPLGEFQKIQTETKKRKKEKEMVSLTRIS